MLKLILRLFAIVFVIIAPFVFLIRGAVFAHVQYRTHAWISVLIGAFLMIFVVFLYLSLLRRRLTRRKSTSSGRKIRMILAMVFVFGFAFQGLMYISAKNVKQTRLQAEYKQLHPLLRLSVGTIIVIDRSAIITDAQRVPEDYRKMGLKQKRNSLHYRQKDGYVYAVDFRTNGRSELRNTLIRLYFRLMGFQTLRHVGTDDHLHVSLKHTDKPWAK